MDYASQRLDVIDRLNRLGYKGEKCLDSVPRIESEILESSAQWKLRMYPQLLRTDDRQYEVVAAILEALVIQGSIAAHDGDGVGCVAQMIIAQANRAGMAEVSLEACRKRIELMAPDCAALMNVEAELY
jgi:hypothetical protein